MKNLKKSHIVLLVVFLLILLGCIGMSVYLLFSNYQNVRLFKEAQNNFKRGDNESLALAEAQLLQVIRNDADNESACIMLAEIAGKQKIYPEQLYYCYMAHRLNPLSQENKDRYIKSLCFARFFDRLENFISQQTELSDEQKHILLYAACRNGNMDKYEKLIEKSNDQFSAAQLAILRNDNSAPAKKLEILKKFTSDDDFLKQELLAVKAEVYLAMNDTDNVEKTLLQAYELNPFAFAPPLGRFYANFRSFGKALKIFEKHLTIYHDPTVAMQTAEIYCLLNKTDKIAELRNLFQADSGNIGMVCCYYFDALIALAKNDISSLKELIVPLRKSINTPLALFMFLCTDLQEKNLSAIQSGYTALISRQNHPDLQRRADNMIADFLKYSLSQKDRKEDELLPLATLLYERAPDAFTAKFILLAQQKNNKMNISLLKNALKKFPKDQGLIKLGIEFYLNHESGESRRLIAYYKQNFPEKAKDMLRYEIILALQKKDFDRVSSLFKNNFSKNILPEYWTFASSTMREDDLLFLCKDKLYEPFCQALLLLKKGQKNTACALLEKADAAGNLSLLFFAAKTLAENGRNQAALNKYALFPEKSSYTFAVLLNMAELFAENGNLQKALELSRKAYEIAPDSPEAQLCYADKLHKNDKLAKIPDVIKLSPKTPYYRTMKKLWVTGMQQRIKNCNINIQQEKVRELCRQLLIVEADNNIALEYLKKLNKMPQ